MSNNGKKSGGGLITIVFIIILVILLNSCGGSSHYSSSSNSYSGYSSTYKNDPNYRKNIGEIAKTWGISEKEADYKINAVTGGK